MKLTKNVWLRTGMGLGLCLAVVWTGWRAGAQAVSTTTVQGTVYLANGQPGAGSLGVSWPAFTTANGQAVAAGRVSVGVARDGFVSVNLTPNLGATPAGLYYTAVYHMSDGTTSTEYWVVPAAAQASLGQVRAQLMPAAQAVQAVNKGYVDQAIAQLAGSLLTASGGTLSGPLYLSGDPTQALQAADKHYVDATFGQAVPLSGGTMTGPLQTPGVNGVESPLAGGAQGTLQAAVDAAGASGAVLIPPNYAGTDGFTNPNGVLVTDLRQGGAQQSARSVKEFGAVCDGVTDDTGALQAALNYAQGNGVALTIPQGICKTRTLAWHGESLGGQGRQVSGLMGYPGQDVLATAADSAGLPANTRIHDLTIYVDQSVDVSCSPAAGRAPAGSCGMNRPLEANSIFSPGGSGLTGTAGTGVGWAVGNCGIAMPAVTGAGGNGLRQAQIENLGIVATGADPMGQYAGAHSTHVCGLYLAQWPQGSEFRNIEIRGLNTGIAVGAPAGGIAAGLTADSNRWENLTLQATHGFTAVAGSNNVVDNATMTAINSAATGEEPTGLVLDFAGVERGWTVRNVVVAPVWNAVQPRLTVAAAGGAVIGVTVGPEHGLGLDPYGTQIAVNFSGACTAKATASVNGDGSIGTVTVTQGGVGCSGTTAASLSAAGTWDTAAAVNLIAGQGMTFTGGNLLKGNGGYTVWNAAGGQSYGMQLGGGGNQPGGGTYPALVMNDGLGGANGYSGSANSFEQLGLSGGLDDNGLGNALVQANAAGAGEAGVEPARMAANTVSADFALLGAGAANQGFTSLNDLFLSAEDLLWAGGESGGTGSTFGKDAAAPVTGSYVKAVGGAWNTQGPWHVRGAANGLVLGQGFPAGQGTWFVAAKADAAATQELKLTGVNGAGASCVFGDKTVSLTTSWQVFSIPYNTVTGNGACDGSTQGRPVSAAALTPGTATNVETAWVAFVPAFQSIELAQPPVQSNQAATKGYVDQSISSQIVNGSGMLPLSGGTLTGPLRAPAINGTTNCALNSGGGVGACVAGASSALIPAGTAGSFAQGMATAATATCVYDWTQGGAITQVNPGTLGFGYTTAPAVNVTGGGGTGLAVTANVWGGQVTSYSITNGGAGYTSCPSIAVAAPPAGSAPIAVLDQRRGVTTYSADVRVDDFGCAGDGVTDDTQCINAAMQYATAGGTVPGSIALTSGKSYLVTQITGYMATASDDGTAPASGDTCALSNAANGMQGTACTNLAPETPGQLGFALKVPRSGLTVYGNGSTIVGNWSSLSQGAASYTLAAPYIAIFGNDAYVGNLTVKDLTISHAFIGFASPGFAGNWIFHNVQTGVVGVSILANILQLAEFRDITFQSMAGIVVGGWWGCRSANYNCYTANNFADNILVDGYIFNAMAPSAPAGGVVQNQNSLDNWFDTYFFHAGDNSTRMTDSQYASLGQDTDSFWRGIFGVGIAYYSRYGRASNSNVIRDYLDKVGMSYPLVVTTPVNLVVDTMSGEGVGECINGSPWGTPGVCPNPYDSADAQLQAAVLMQSPSSVVVRNVETGGIDAEEVVGLSWRQPMARNLAKLRMAVSVESSQVSSRWTVGNPQAGSLRKIWGVSNAVPAGGAEDSGEECFQGLGNFGTGSDPDTWCMRYALSAYGGTTGMPRYFVFENEYNGIHFTGPTAVQMPGLRVRAGAIAGTDTTLPVTDLSGQAFNIAGGTVSGESCATVSGVALPGAVTADGVLFVQAPSSAAPLQLAGSITAANTMSLSVCNPTTGAASFPAGTYTAFLVDGAPPGSSPATSGGQPASTNPLTTTVGDLVAANGSGVPGRLAGSTAAQTAVLTQTGTGGASAVPAWQTAPAFSGANLTNLNAANLTLGTVGIANGGTGASSASQALANLGGASVSAATTQFAGEVTGLQVGAAYQVDQFAGVDFGAKLAACLGRLSATSGGTCDARNFSGTVGMGANLTVPVGNATILLPCATIATANQLIVPAGTRNVTLRGCALRGASQASGSQGGTVFLYSGSGAMVQVGDPTYAADTMGFHLDDVVINTTGAANASAQALAAYRTQEMDVESLYLLGNQNQTGVTLDGTGNYTGGTFFDIAANGFQTAINAIGHQASNAATTDWLNASTFVRVHIDCPTSGGSPISGTYGINLQQGDGNTFTGGDVEGCTTAVHLGVNAQNNTFVGLRNENSANQVVADTGSAYNSWITGGTMFTGALTDSGTRNSFLDTFHRSFNGLNGDWYGSQKDATVTNHFRIGTGAGNERGLLNRYQTDAGYRWTMGLSDGTAGEQFYQVLDELNNVYRLSVGQYNAGQGSTNNQTVINAAGTGAVVLNGSNNAGTGGVVFGSGGPSESTVAAIDGSGNETLGGTLQVSGVTTHVGSVTVKNQADAEIDSTLWAGATGAQKESFVYKDWNGASQWYMVKDLGNNWALNSAIDGTDHLKAYQSGETMLNANGSGAVTVNREANAGTGGLVIYSGGASPAQVAKIDSAGNVTASGSVTSKGNVVVQNGANAEADVVVQPGASSEQNGAFQLNSVAGVAQWKLKKDGSNYFRVNDAVNGLDRMVLYQNGATNLNAGAGANAVVVNNVSGSGSGGLIVYGGGTSNYNTQEWSVNGAGQTMQAGPLITTSNAVSSISTGGGVYVQNTQTASAGSCAAPQAVALRGTYWTGSASAVNSTTLTASCTAGTNGAETLTLANAGSTGVFTAAVNGALTAQTHAGSGTMALSAGAAAGMGPSIGCAASHVCDGVSGTVSLTTGTAPGTGTLATLTFPAGHVNQANCVVTATLSGLGMVTSVSWSESTTALTLTANAALSAGTAYQVRYWCGGN